MPPDASSMSTAELKRALRELGADPSELAECIERPDFEALYAQTVRRQRQGSRPSHGKQPTVELPSGNQGGGGLDALTGMSWQTWALIGLAFYWFSGGFGGGEASGPHVAPDEAYLTGQVAEVSSLPAFKAAIALHRDGTGLPVVVDFYSHSCGPCRMIAPAYKRLAEEMKGRAALLKVDVNGAYDVSSEYGVHSMPTFLFFYGGNVAHRFSGADQRQLQSTTSDLARRAERSGTFVGQEVTASSLQAFYGEHDPSKVREADTFATRYANKTAQLVRLLRKKYGSAPKTSKVAERSAPPTPTHTAETATRTPPNAPGRTTGVEALRLAATDDLRAELRRRQDESAAELGAAAPLSPPVTTEAQPASVVILGGGPAGLSAAIYAARAGLRPILVAPTMGAQPLGQLEGKGVDVENFPGVHGATGPSLVGLMRTQAAAFNASLVNDVVAGLELGRRPFRLRLNGTAEAVHTRALILAMGAESKWLGVAGEEEHRGGGVSSCATCDGFLFRGQDVLVVGGGDSAAEDALVLARTSRSVTMVHRGARLRASHALASRVIAHPKVTVRFRTTVQSFGGNDGRVTHATLRTNDEGEPARDWQLSIGAAFVAIGHRPNTGLLQSSDVRLTSDQYIDMSQSGRSSRTTLAGVFAAGDVADPVYRQAITSAGSGAQAALDAERWLSEGQEGAD